MQPSLLGLARRIPRDGDASADVVQRAFVKVLLHSSQSEGRAALRTWVWRIAANEALQWLRERGRSERKHAALADQGVLFSRRRTLDRIGAALAKLSQGDRTLIERTFTASRSPIAESNGVSQRMHRARLYRARQRLQSVLEEERRSADWLRLQS